VSVRASRLDALRALRAAGVPDAGLRLRRLPRRKGRGGQRCWSRRGRRKRTMNRPVQGRDRRHHALLSDVRCRGPDHQPSERHPLGSRDAKELAVPVRSHSDPRTAPSNSRCSARSSPASYASQD